MSMVTAGRSGARLTCPVGGNDQPNTAVASPRHQQPAWSSNGDASMYPSLWVHKEIADFGDRAVNTKEPCCETSPQLANSLQCEPPGCTRGVYIPQGHRRADRVSF